MCWFERLCWGFSNELFVVDFYEGGFLAQVEMMESLDFMREILEYMEILGLSDLEGSGLRFPAEGWDWLDCCHACVWLGFAGYELPDNLLSRLVLGPSNHLVVLYFKWLSHKSSLQKGFDIWDLAG